MTNAFAHPILVSTALVVAGWQQRLAFHGGAVLDRGGRAWGILSDREGGRTMFLGWCAAHGLDVLASDLVVTDGLEVFAGPRLLDLDENESRHYALGDDIGVVGNRRRWRVALPEVPTTAPLGGWLTLVHGPDRELRPLGVPERARLLKRSRRVDIARHHQQPWLQALTVPAFAATSRRGNPPEDTAMRSLFETLDATTESSMS
ncbi:hypothetical protein HQ325_12300 [Rhodococcus sp. BP-349]|uniref:hypothetical protein n=1 Tax=unclassified Rhodococcus (in: high G+C Gram-positive bacteria) TaxID=192944 RepID=UPI001C9A81D6|nr:MULTISPECIES: hypothetical protein [unclassified Rhodococcus (in: high G+C Gram-positive bacteria)]MBY6539455.1 hypothetical protein [Rhodococcus sp. BP-363]MBY6544217.1 hypothetical protein [Rhodococcus sp. BP-369]MBY6563447.1 hypothetical protein [Rhodococcus sp. BP-370]MBY6577739.1 hypothetical protein [Rhodococcus sp. BP-364]MBY6587040.1 hypothetical protein [Rhodococcus sp. BP-358]